MGLNNFKEALNKVNADKTASLVQTKVVARIAAEVAKMFKPFLNETLKLRREER